MEYTLKIESNNAAFEDPAAETVRILKEQIKRIEQGDLGYFNLRDYNGNTVGEAYFDDNAYDDED